MGGCCFPPLSAGSEERGPRLSMRLVHSVTGADVDASMCAKLCARVRLRYEDDGLYFEPPKDTDAEPWLEGNDATFEGNSVSFPCAP